jgi:hypothetical protein
VVGTITGMEPLLLSFARNRGRLADLSSLLMLDRSNTFPGTAGLIPVLRDTYRPPSNAVLEPISYSDSVSKLDRPKRVSHYLDVAYAPLQLTIGSVAAELGMHNTLTGTLFDSAIRRIFNYVTPIQLLRSLMLHSGKVSAVDSNRENNAAAAVKEIIHGLVRSMETTAEFVFFLRVCQVRDDNDVIIRELISIEDVVPHTSL